MNPDHIHPQLKNDTIHLGELNGQTLLLLNNALVPWFIVLPNTEAIELYRLEAGERQTLEHNVDVLSEFLVAQYAVDKVNVASIGNIVAQMHMHIVGRFRTDPFWPGVVWGRAEKEPYSSTDITRIAEQLSEALDTEFVAAS